MKQFVLASAFLALPFLPGCHLDDARREYGSQERLDRVEKAVGQLGLLIPRLLAGDPTAIAPTAKSGWNVLEWLGGFIFTAIAGGAAGHVNGRRVERKKKRVPDDVRPERP